MCRTASCVGDFLLLFCPITYFRGMENNDVSRSRIATRDGYMSSILGFIGHGKQNGENLSGRFLARVFDINLGRITNSSNWAQKLLFPAEVAKQATRNHFLPDGRSRCGGERETHSRKSPSVTVLLLCRASHQPSRTISRSPGRERCTRVDAP